MARATLSVVVVLVLTVAPSAARAEPLVVVNIAGDAPAREQARARTVELRDHLLGAGVARQPAAELAGVVVGEPAPRAAAPAHVVDLSEVRSAYASFEYARAQELLGGEIAPLLAASASDKLAIAVAEILYWRGKVAVADGSRRAAMTWFYAVLDLAPDWSVDAGVDPPSVQKAFAAARKRRGKRARGTLRVDSPGGGEVSIDGGVGRSLPVTAALAVGPHLVVVTRAGHLRHAELVTVSPRTEALVDATLVAEPAATLLMRALLEVAAIPPQGRLAAMKPVAARLGSQRLLAVETGDDGLVVVRYDLVRGEVSRGAALGDAGIPDEVAKLAGVEVATAPALAPLPADPLQAPRRAWRHLLPGSS